MFFSSLTMTYRILNEGRSSLKYRKQVSSNLDRSAVVFFSLLSCLIKVEREKKWKNSLTSNPTHQKWLCVFLVNVQSQAEGDKMREYRFVVMTVRAWLEPSEYKEHPVALN